MGGGLTGFGKWLVNLPGDVYSGIESSMESARQNLDNFADSVGSLIENPTEEIHDFATFILFGTNGPGSDKKNSGVTWQRLQGKKIVGLQSPRLVGANGLTDTTDYSGYPDRAILKLTNSSGSPINVNGLAIIGKIVFNNARAYEWESTDYESIDQNGETSVTIENDYMISADQVESVGDYIRKSSANRPSYKISIPGCHYEYERGDVWHLTLSYTIPGESSEAENIDTDLEIQSVAIQRAAGGIGSTIVQATTPIGAWTKTTSKRARLISAGMPQVLNNRGNVISIGASIYTGQADYYCDGTADNVQIQSAIDSIYSMGGGIVLLQDGTFNITDAIVLKSGVSLIGSSVGGTIIKNAGGTFTKYIDVRSTNSSKVANITIDGNKANYTHSATIYGVYGNSSDCEISSIIVKNIKASIDGPGLSVGIIAFNNCKNIINCSASGCEAINTGTTGIIADSQCVGFYSCNQLTGCYSGGNSASSTASYTAVCVSFYSCQQLNNCVSASNTISGSASSFKAGYWEVSSATNCKTTDSGTGSIGFYAGRSLQQCKSITNATHYNGSYADSGTANACADTYQGGFNS